MTERNLCQNENQNHTYAVPRTWQTSNNSFTNVRVRVVPRQDMLGHFPVTARHLCIKFQLYSRNFNYSTVNSTRKAVTVPPTRPASSTRLSCFWRLPKSPKRRSHTRHLQGRTPVWRIMWRRNSMFRTHAYPQTLRTKCSRSVILSFIAILIRLGVVANVTDSFSTKL